LHAKERKLQVIEVDLEFLAEEKGEQWNLKQKLINEILSVII
jgi:hypothetical protein